MRTLPILVFALGLVGSFASCGGDDETTGGTTATSTNTTTTTSTSTTGAGGSGATGGGTTTTTTTGAGGSTGGSGSGGEPPTPSMNWIGGDCSCDGNGCDQYGVPKPAGGTVVGCDDVPANWTGAALSCLRTYNGDIATNTWFANGYCSLMATKCTGSGLICGSAVWGDFDAMTTCPAGSVLLETSEDVTALGQSATVESKICARGCTGDGQCREGETDPVLGDEATQYECVDHGGVRFCYDPRNLPDTYTSTAF